MTFAEGHSRRLKSRDLPVGWSELDVIALTREVLHGERVTCPCSCRDRTAWQAAFGLGCLGSDRFTDRSNAFLQSPFKSLSVVPVRMSPSVTSLVSRFYAQFLV